MTGRRFAVLLLLLAVSACGRAGGPAPLLLGDDGGAGTARGTARIAAPGTVIVRQGDSLYVIARRTGVPLRGLIELNDISAPYVIYPGQVLKLPTAHVHVVERGDTVTGIAALHDVDPSALVAVNDLPPPYRLHPGQTLKLPSADAKAAPTPTAAPRAQPRPAPVAREVEIGEPPERSGRRFGWPLTGRILVGFGAADSGLRNDGINIAARPGTIVRASESGVVAYIGNELRGFGNLVLLKHADGWMTAYAHNQAFLVKVGDKVSRGQPIARVGTSGGVAAPQLHFEIRRGARAVDPRRYLGPLPTAGSPGRVG